MPCPAACRLWIRRAGDGGQSIGGGLPGVAKNVSVIAATVAGVCFVTWAGKSEKEKLPIGMDTF